DLEINLDAGQGFQFGLDEIVQLRAGPTLVTGMTPQIVIAKDGLATFLFLGLIQQMIQDACVVVQVLEIQTLRQLQAVCRLGGLVAVPLLVAVAQDGGDRPPKGPETDGQDNVEFGENLVDDEAQSAQEGAAELQPRQAGHLQAGTGQEHFQVHLGNV